MKRFLSGEVSSLSLYFCMCTYLSAVYGSTYDNDVRTLQKHLKDEFGDSISKHHPHHFGPPMGIPQRNCDDGKHGIETDWNPLSTKEYTCYPTDRIQNTAFPKEIHEKDSSGSVYHICLDKHIHYKTPLPLSGNHRPLWPKYGEYIYAPPQRWVHSLEHGAVVLLYHPCMAGSDDAENLKQIVRGCLRKHIITPYRKLLDSHPLAVLTYHHGLLLSHFDVSDASQYNRVVDFIMRYAQKSPEHRVAEDGQYSVGLLYESEIVSDENDSELCPHF